MCRVLLAGALRFNIASRLRFRVLLLMSFEFPVCYRFGSCLDQGTANSALNCIGNLRLSDSPGRSRPSSTQILFFSELYFSPKKNRLCTKLGLYFLPYSTQLATISIIAMVHEYIAVTPILIWSKAKLKLPRIQSQSYYWLTLNAIDPHLKLVSRQDFVSTG